MPIRSLRTWVRNTVARRAAPARPRRPMLVELEARVNPADPYLVADINAVPTAAGSAPTNFVDVNGTVYFTAATPVHGDELWKSDGTEAGTVLVKDIFPGVVGSNIMHLTNVNGTLFFVAQDGTHAFELWKSDGTEAGTVMVKDISPGFGNTVFQSLTDFNGTLFFVCHEAVNGIELWKSDGTEAGTVLVKDINPGASSANLQALTVAGGALYFAATDGTSGSELWKSDGTTAGTVRVADIVPGAVGSNPNYLTAVNGTVYFRASDAATGNELWKSDGTAAGTVLVKDIRTGASGSSPVLLTNVQGTLYFRATDGTAGYELWKTDGTDAGTLLVKDINPGSGSSGLVRLTAVGGTLFFQANNGTSGNELWKSDGTAAGTAMVKDIHPTAAGLNNGPLANVNGTVYFAANDGATGQELWKSDGTAAGTVLVRDIRPGANGSNTAALAAVGGALFFAADDGATGGEVWKSDGTAAGTVRVKDILHGTSSSSPRQPTDVNGTLFFVASDGTNGQELWKSNGTAAGTALVKDIRPGATGSNISSLVNLNGTLFFSATDGTNGQELWKSDGTAAGTVMVKNIGTGSADSSPVGLTVLNGALYFAATNSTAGTELWKSDGTDAGTVLVKDVRPGGASGLFSAFPYLEVMGGTLYFRADDGVNGTELWKSDGTAAGTGLVLDIWPGSSSGDPLDLTAAGGTLFFYASDSTHGRELWKSDGTAAGTVMVEDLKPGTDTLLPQNLTAVGGSVFFTGNDGTNGRELYTSDGTEAGTFMVKDLNPGFPSTNPSNLFGWKGALYFSAGSPGQGNQLWKSDGTEAGTVMVQDGAPGTKALGPAFLTVLNDTLYFSALDRTSGAELWASDGTGIGTVRIGEIVPGSGSSAPNNMAAAGGRLYFAATTEAAGQELWAYEPAAAPTVTFSAASQSGAESAGTLTITAQLSAVTTKAVTVPFTVGGTAANGPDYTITASPISIPAGSLTGTITITIVDDPTDEPNETVVVTMGTPTNATPGGTKVHTATILDNDAAPLVSFTSAGGSAVEGVGTRTATVALSAASAFTVTVPFGVSGTAANPADYTLAPASPLTFAPGETTKTVTITVSDDGLHEADETAVLTLGTPTNGSLGATTTFTETIVNDDAAPVASFTAAGGSALENVPARTATVVLSAPSALTVTVPYSVGGTATNPDDYTLSPGSPLTFAPGETTKSITITVVADGVAESDETVVLTLEAPTNGTLGSPATYTETIQEGGGFTISPPSRRYTTEWGGTVTFTVVLTTPPTADVVIPVASSDLTEAAVSPAQLVFTPADANNPQTVTVTGLGDAFPDLNQLYSVLLGPAQSDDPRYAGLNPADVGLVNVDALPGGKRRFIDSDGDLYTVQLTGPGQVGVLLGGAGVNGPGPIDEIILSPAVNPLRSKLVVTVTKVPGGDGLVDIGAATGPGLLAFTATRSDLVGAGVRFDGYLGGLKVRDIESGADVIAVGLPPRRTAITAADVGDGTTIDVGGLSTLKVARFGEGQVTAPRIGTLSVTGNKGRAIAADFEADVRLTGAGVLPGTKALGSVVVGGTIRDSAIEVAGNVGSVRAKFVEDSSLLLGLDGTMQAGLKLGTFAATGLLGSTAPAFVDSTIVADQIGTVTLKSVATNQPDQTFGVTAGTSLTSLKVTSPPFVYNAKTLGPQGLDLDEEDGDLEFVVRVG